MIKIIFLALIFTSCFNGFKTANRDLTQLNLVINRVNISDGNFSIDFRLKNISNTTTRVYKPRKSDLCSSLLRINAKEKKTGNKYKLIPCDFIASIDEVIATTTNSEILGPNEYLNFKIQSSIDDFSPHLPLNLRGKVFLFNVIIDHSAIVSSTDSISIFQNKISSDSIRIRF